MTVWIIIAESLIGQSSPQTGPPLDIDDVPVVTRFLSIKNNPPAILGESCCHFVFSKTIRKESESIWSGGEK